MTSSSLILRSLLLPENNQVQSTEKSKLQGLIYDNLQTTENQSVETESALGKLDSLRLSGLTQSSKGRVPIQLMQPSEINSNTSYTAPKNTQAKIAGSGNLTSINNEFKNVPKAGAGSVTNAQSSSATPSKAVFNPNISTSFAADDGKKILGNTSALVTSIVKFVDEPDKTSEKLAFAIAKIQDWDRKVGALDALLEEQKKSSGDMSSLVVTGSQRLTTARNEATNARKDAILSFNEAVKQINAEAKSTGIRSTLYNEYKNSSDQMEKMFSITMERDKSTMGKVMDYLKATLTADNLNKALNFINPLSIKY